MNKRVIIFVILILVAIFVYSAASLDWQLLVSERPTVYIRTVQYDGKTFYVFVTPGNGYQGTGIAVVEKKP